MGLVVLIVLTILIAAITITGLSHVSRKFHAPKNVTPIQLEVAPQPLLPVAVDGGKTAPPSLPSPAPRGSGNTPAGKAPQPSGPGMVGASR